MRGLKINYMKRGHIYGHRDSTKESAKGPILWKGLFLTQVILHCKRWLRHLKILMFMIEGDGRVIFYTVQEKWWAPYTTPFFIPGAVQNSCRDSEFQVKVIVQSKALGPFDWGLQGEGFQMPQFVNSPLRRTKKFLCFYWFPQFSFHVFTFSCAFLFLFVHFTALNLNNWYPACARKSTFEKSTHPNFKLLNWFRSYGDVKFGLANGWTFQIMKY